MAGVAEQHADGGSTAGDPVLFTITLIPFTSGAGGQSLRVADAKYPPPCAPCALGPMLISAAQSRMICGSDPAVSGCAHGLTVTRSLTGR